MRSGSKEVQNCAAYAWDETLATEQQLIGRRVGGHLITAANCADMPVDARDRTPRELLLLPDHIHRALLTPGNNALL